MLPTTNKQALGMASFLARIHFRMVGRCPSWGSCSARAGCAWKSATTADVTVSRVSPCEVKKTQNFGVINKLYIVPFHMYPLQN